MTLHFLDVKKHVIRKDVRFALRAAKFTIETIFCQIAMPG